MPEPCECPARKALEQIRDECLWPAAVRLASAALSAACPCEELRAELAAIGEQLEFDRTALADAITGVKKAFDSRFWLTEGRGSYEWDDDRYRAEFIEAYQEISKAIEPLKKIAADWSGCPRSARDVAAARIDLKSENQRLRADLAEALEALRGINNFAQVSAVLAKHGKVKA